MNDWLKNRLQSKRTPMILAFLIPVVIMIGVCINHEIYPFGSNCFLHIDMYHQYAPFFTEFMNQLKSGDSLVYTWNLGLGSDFVSLYAYYLASPMNWLLLLCPQAHVIEFMTILIIVKIGLSGLTFGYFLRQHYQTDSYKVVLFAVFYALCGFTCAYSWDIMWLDTVWLAPLIILGLERLLDDKKCGLYFVTLALSIFSNYYISIMVCIFLVLYFFMLLIERPARCRIGSFLRFGIYSLLAGGCSAVLLLPEIKVLGNSGSGNVSFPDSIEWYFNVLDELARSCLGVDVIATTEHWPSLYSGAAVILLVFLFVMNREISKKSKALKLILLAVFLVSFANNQLNFIWHGFHFPDGLPARQAFLYSFMILMIGFETVHHLKGNTVIHVGVGVGLSYALLAAFAVFTDTTKVTVHSIVLTGVLIGAYALIIILYRGKDRSFRQIAVVFAFLLVITESAVNLDMTGVITTSRTTYVANQDEYQYLTSEIKQQDSDFYRIDKFNRLTKNESSLIDYPSASIFSSLINLDVGDYYRELGMEGGKNYYCYNGATALTSAMLSVKYMLTDSAVEESPLRTLIDSDNGIYLYENNYTLPVAYMVDAGLEDTWNYTAGTSVEAQNFLAYALGASEDLLDPIETEVKGNETNIFVEKSGYVYGYYTDKSAKTINATVGDRNRTFSKCDHVYLLDLGWCEAGDVITLNSPDVTFVQVQGYQLNMDVFSSVYETLSEQTLTVDSYTDTTIDGHITVTKAGNLVFSVPDDEGFDVYVDGEQVTYSSFGEAFIQVPLGEGEHEVHLEYHTPGWPEGIAISLGCLALFIVITGMKVMINKRKKECIQSEKSE